MNTLPIPIVNNDRPLSAHVAPTRRQSTRKIHGTQQRLFCYIVHLCLTHQRGLTSQQQSILDHFSLDTQRILYSAHTYMHSLVHTYKYVDTAK